MAPLLEQRAAASFDRAREIVIAHGWNSTSYQILNPGISHWFSESHTAVTGYTRRGRFLLVAGGPVCEPGVLASVCEEFERFAHAQGSRVCYVCAELRLRSILAGSPRHAAIAMGAQPVWSPRSWTEIVRRRASLRAQLYRALNKEVAIESMAWEDAATNPELRGVLAEWIAGRHLPPLHFLVEPDVLDGIMRDRVVFTAYRRSRVVAFLVASPVRARNGYLVELLARSAAAPNGTSELLIDAAMRTFAAERCDYITLGLVALTHAADAEIRQNPAWLRWAMYFARAHANRFYNFRGLEHFRVKMEPEQWESVYAIANERRFSVASLYAVGAAFSGISPWSAIGIGVAKAAREELRRLVRQKP